MIRCSSSLCVVGRASLLVLALCAIPAGPARAQCVEDADCGPGRVCEPDEPKLIDCLPDQDCPTPEPDPEVELRCVDAPCSEDADCPSGFACELGGAAASPPCARDGECPEPEPLPEPEGRCEAQPIACEVDGDCPTGLSCVEEQGGDSAGLCAAPADGEEGCTPVPEPEPEPATRACGYAPMECEQDSDCTQAGYACIVSEGSSSCSDAPCSADGECPEEIVCEDSEVRFCFPARADCTSDSDCEEGWRCYTLTEQQTREPPESYEGATAVCWPEGIVLAITEQIELADVDSGAGRGSSASDSGAISPPVGVDTESPTKSSGDGESAAEASGEDSGCSAAAPATRGVRGTPLLLVLASVVVLACRRRARAA